VVRSVQAGINPAPTQGVREPLVGAGLTPARIGCRNLEIAQIREKLHDRCAEEAPVTLRPSLGDYLGG
jgi:hypothetical protein